MTLVAMMENATVLRWVDYGLSLPEGPHHPDWLAARARAYNPNPKLRDSTLRRMVSELRVMTDPGVRKNQGTIAAYTGNDTTAKPHTRRWTTAWFRNARHYRRNWR
jgi:hypothetical protein